MKKIPVLILCAVLLTAPLIPTAVESAALRSGDYEYTLSADGTAILTKYLGSAPILTIPPNLAGHPVTEIGNDAFSRNANLKRVSMPEGVQRIGRNAFSGCNLLLGVDLPESLLEIGSGAFQYCTMLEEIRLPAGLQAVGIAAFAACYSLPAFTQGEGSQAFIVLDGVLYDPRTGTLTAYPAGKKDTAYLISEGTLKILSSAFDGATFLQDLTLPESLTELGDHALYGLTGLQAIEIPESVTLIGDNAFSSCDQLVSLRIPAGVTRLIGAPFFGAAGMEEFLVDGGSSAFSSRDGVLYDKAGTALLSYPRSRRAEEFKVPEGVLKLGDWAFAHGGVLKRLTLPDGLLSIGLFAFRICQNLEEISIPASVDSIGKDAFWGCDKLTLRVAEGSCAQTYARENAVPFVVQGNTP